MAEMILDLSMSLNCLLVSLCGCAVCLFTMHVIGVMVVG